MKNVFMSYARPDFERAKRIFNQLKLFKKIEPWFDKYSLLPGMKWEPAIRKAIRESDYFLAILSCNTTSRRGFQNSELDQALKVLSEFPSDQIYIIPVRLDECKMPRDELSELNWVDLFPDWNAGMEKIISVLAEELENIDKDSNSSLATDQSFSYHYRVGLVDLDIGLTNLKNLAQKLNELQTFFHFTSPELPSTQSAVMNIGGLKNLAVFKISSSFYAEHRYLAVDLVACLTKYPLAFKEDGNFLYNYFSGPSDNDRRFMFISTTQLYEFSREAGKNFEQGLVFILVGQLASYFTNLEYHEETRSCVMDFCEKRSDIVQGLRSEKFCEFCLNQLPENELKNSLLSMLKWNDSN